MAVVASCNIDYLDRFAGPFARSILQNTRHKVHLCVTSGEPWRIASERFFFARKLDEPELVILDIDSVIVRDFLLPEGEVGLYLRPDSPEPMRVAAGMVVVRKKGFLDALCANLEKETGWFADQRALWKTCQSYPADYFDVSPFMTWDFDDKPIWTGKGPRKRSETFRAKLAEYR